MDLATYFSRIWNGLPLTDAPLSHSGDRVVAPNSDDAFRQKYMWRNDAQMLPLAPDPVWNWGRQQGMLNDAIPLPWRGGPFPPMQNMPVTPEAMSENSPFGHQLNFDHATRGLNQQDVIRELFASPQYLRNL